VSILGLVIGLVITVSPPVAHQAAPAQPAQQSQAAAPAATFTPAALDKLLAPVALYPDQLLTQMLLCTSNPPKIQELSGWLVRNAELTGTAMQNAAEKAGFEPSFVVLALFPQVVNYMADNIAWTRELGKAFATDRKGVLDSVQRLRAEAKAVGSLKSTPQQKVETKTTGTGEQAIVIEPANPQVVYVPQYNPQVVYTQPTTTTVVVKEEDDSDEAAALGALVGFTAGIAIGAAMDNDYYYGPYGWHGGGYMYNDAWDDFYDDREDAREDFYDHREDAREDWQDHREDNPGQRSERANTAQQERTERQQQRTDKGTTAQQQRAERTGSTGASATGASATPSSTQQSRQANRAEGQTTRQGTSATTASAESRGGSGTRQSSVDRSGTRSDAFSGYSSGSRERSASSRGSRSRGSRSGGGGRRR
jgi:uncharacterized protein DUF3300